MKLEPGYMNIFKAGGWDLLIAQYEITKTEKMLVLQQVWLLDYHKGITQIFYTTRTQRI
jgi:hypothetical protein